jgi:hypothetical protein
MALATLRNISQNNILMYGQGIVDAWDIVEPLYLRRAKKTSSECFVILADYQTCYGETQPEDPEMVSVQDLFFGTIRPRGNSRSMHGHLICRLTTTTCFTVGYDLFQKSSR